MKNALPCRLLVPAVLVVTLGAATLVGGCSSKTEEGPAPRSFDEDAKAPGTGGGGGGGDEGLPGAGQDSGAPTPPQDAGAKDSSAKDGGDGAAPAACLDDSSPAAQPACPGAGGECQTACDSFAVDYKKGLSADIRKCLSAAICMNDTTTCADKALAKACTDATATTFCTPMVQGCKAANAGDTITQASCEGLAKGLTRAGRDALQGCFETDAVCGDCLAKLK